MEFKTPVATEITNVSGYPVMLSAPRGSTSFCAFPHSTIILPFDAFSVFVDDDRANLMLGVRSGTLQITVKMLQADGTYQAVGAYTAIEGDDYALLNPTVTVKAKTAPVQSGYMEVVDATDRAERGGFKMLEVKEEGIGLKHKREETVSVLVDQAAEVPVVSATAEAPDTTDFEAVAPEAADAEETVGDAPEETVEVTSGPVLEEPKETLQDLFTDKPSAEKRTQKKTMNRKK